MIPALIRAGYETRFVVGLITTAGTLGLVIPPSITLIIYGAVTGTSIGQLFAAGLLPGLTIGALLMIYCVIHARRRGMAMGRPPRRQEIGAALRQAVWALGLPVLLLGGIYSGVFTPTESAAVACLYGLVVGLAITRGLKPGDLFEVFRSAGLISATLLLITAGASAFSWLLASQAIPTQIASAILSFTENRYAVLALFNVILLLAGCFLDGASAVIILAPLMTPIAASVGVDPVHFGIITLINVEIGMLTPPVGLNLFVACAIAKLPLQEVVKAVLPTLGILFLGLLLVTYVPALSLWLPGLLYP
jgi:C4-dicarboxylate transporter DctM subunit